VDWPQSRGAQAIDLLPNVHRVTVRPGVTARLCRDVHLHARIRRRRASICRERAYRCDCDVGGSWGTGL